MSPRRLPPTYCRRPSGSPNGSGRSLSWWLAARPTQDIAESLQLSVRTVHSHLDRIRNKTGSRRRADLTRFALQRGIVPRSPKEG